MEFILITTGMVAFIVLVLVLIGRSYPGSGADLLDWKPKIALENGLRGTIAYFRQLIASELDAAPRPRDLRAVGE